ncbi:unnamed protein product [Linum trigynum]|uniref:Uncharacterized protein n=1 Tax=Linum trigynum TaxID=586398 RepID=A0AAV2FTF7_9ROSI
MALFDFKSDKHFVTSSDETTIRVCELSDPTVHPSDIRKADWKEVATIDIVDGGNKGGGNSSAEGKYFHHGLLFFDEHGKIEGQEALTKLARHLARSGLMVSPGGYCFQDVTGLGEHRDFGAHYLRLNDLFSWPSHGVDLARITTWRRLELTYTVPRQEGISKRPMVSGGVSEETIEKEEALQKMREEMEETIEKKDAEVRKAKRERDNEKRLKEMIERASKEKYEESRRIVRGKNEELEKLRDELEEDERKLRDEKDGEMQKLKEEMEDTREEEHEKELKRSRKEKDELQEQLNKKDVLLGRASDDLQKLRKEKAEELRNLREEMQEEVENARKEKDEEVEALKRENKEGEKASKEQDEELKNLRDEVETLRRTKDDDQSYATGYNGRPGRFPFRLNAFMGTNTHFFMIRLFEEYRLAFLYRD